MQCNIQLLLLLLHYLVPHIYTADWKIDTYHKGDNNTVNTHIVSDSDSESKVLEDSEAGVMEDGEDEVMEVSNAEVIEDDEDDKGDSFWDMVVPEAFYDKNKGSNDYSDFNIRASMDEPEGEDYQDYVTNKKPVFSAKAAIVASILQKPKKDNNDSFSLGEYKVCKPKGLQKFIEADEKGPAEYKETLKLNKKVYEKDYRKGCSFNIEETKRRKGR